MAKDSSTGGYLAPSSIGGDLNDLPLQRFLQQMVVGVTGMAGQLVRPRWQPEAPNLPDFGTNWAAIGPTRRARDPNAAVLPSSDGTAVTVVRNVEIEILVSFYGPAAEANAELLSMGLMLSQNREAMAAGGYELVGGPSDLVVAPTQTKSQWNYRADLSFTVRHQQKYTYPILSVSGTQGELYIEDTSILTEEISVSAPQE